MRGFLFTALTIMMFMSLFAVSVYFYEQTQAEAEALEIRHIKSRAMYDDVYTDIEHIQNMSSDINRTLTDVEIIYSDFLPPPWNITEVLNNYSIFLGDVYEKELNTNLDMNVSERVPEYPMVPFWYVYGYPSYYKPRVYVMNTSRSIDLLTGYELNVWAPEESLEDVIWVEAEDLEGDRVLLSGEGAYSNESIKRWAANILNKTVQAPLDTNYTLWVRSRDNLSTSLQFKVEVNGVNSSSTFGDHASTESLTWGWEQGDEFHLNNQTNISLYSVSDTEFKATQLDVLVLKTTSEPISYDFSPPDNLTDNLVHKPDELSPHTSTHMDVDLNIYAQDLNYTYSGTVNHTGSSNWVFVFADNTTLNTSFGGVYADGRSSDWGMLLEYYPNGSREYMEHRPGSSEYLYLETHVFYDMI